MPIPPADDIPTGRKESATWEDVYSQNVEIARRRRAMPAKLRRLGFHLANPQAAILDLCCGHGEALDALHEMGFRNLSGMDISIPATLADDPRFTVRVGDVLQSGYSDASFSWILNFHALHHLGMEKQVGHFLDECYRMLKPGGRLSIIDFPASPQIYLAFWWLNKGWLLWSPYLENMSQVIREEMYFLKNYLPQWPRIMRLLYNGRFQVESIQHGLFYFYLTLKKPHLETQD